MTDISSSIRQQIDDFIDNYGDTIIIYSVSNSYNSRGDATVSYGSGTATVGVIMNLDKNSTFQQEGVRITGQPRMIIKSSDITRPNYKITHRSVDYKVTSVRSLVNMEDEANTAKIVELTRL